MIAFELGVHHVPSDGEFPETEGTNILMADGHVESLAVDKAAEAIERSMMEMGSATTRSMPGK